MDARAKNAVWAVTLGLMASVASTCVLQAQPVATPDRPQEFRLDDETLRPASDDDDLRLLEGPSATERDFDPGAFDLERALPAAAPAPAEPARPANALETAAEPAGDLDFDLFDGPTQPRGPQADASTAVSPAPAGSPVAGAATPAGETVGAAGAPPPPGTAFRAVGPVRPPTFSPAAAEGRQNLAVTGLRPGLPIFSDDPFAPDGIRVGSFRLFPVLQQELGVSDNLDEDPSEEGGAFSQTTLTARFLSDWSRHQADINASAVYRRNFGGEIEEDPRLALDAALRLDLAGDTVALLRGALSFAREDPIEADPLVSPSGRPDVLAYSAGAEIGHEFGPVLVSATTDVVREERRLGSLSGVNDFTTASLGLRAGYELSAAFQPFVEGSFGRRFFDERDPFSGVSRDTDIPALRAGLAFDFGEKISGEAAVGYAWSRPRDTALPDFASPTVDVAINWSPRRGTDVLLTAATFFDPEQTGLATSTVYESAVALRHRATARTDLTARLSAAHRDREGSAPPDDTTYAGEAGVTYWLNRGLAFTALARHQRLHSSLEAAEYSANSVRVGLRLQR